MDRAGACMDAQPRNMGTLMQDRVLAVDRAPDDESGAGRM
jgi:hypothetical protein